jgi:hypothetical protein
VTPDAPLAELVAELEGAGISCLVMGGHAVRYYGLARHTNDVDLQIAHGQWDDLPGLLARTHRSGNAADLEGHADGRWTPGSRPGRQLVGCACRPATR